MGNPLKRADICTRFFQPIHQRHEVVCEGRQTSPRMDPAFQGLLAGLLKQETDAAVADQRQDRRGLVYRF